MESCGEYPGIAIGFTCNTGVVAGTGVILSLGSLSSSVDKMSVEDSYGTLWLLIDNDLFRWPQMLTDSSCVMHM